MSLLSPVIITTLIPASLHVFIEFLTSSRGGSIIPTSPTKIRSLSGSSPFSSFLYATASTLSALDASEEFSLYIFSFKLSVSLIFLPFLRTYLHLFITLSSAPFVKTYLSPSTILTVDIILRSLSNGTSPTRGNLPSKSSLFAPK